MLLVAFLIGPTLSIETVRSLLRPLDCVTDVSLSSKKMLAHSIILQSVFLLTYGTLVNPYYSFADRSTIIILST